MLLNNLYLLLAKFRITTNLKSFYFKWVSQIREIHTNEFLFQDKLSSICFDIALAHCVTSQAETGHIPQTKFFLQTHSFDNKLFFGQTNTHTFDYWQLEDCPIWIQ